MKNRSNHLIKSIGISCIFAAVISLFFISCNKKSLETAAVSVVTSSFPCYDAARAVLGKTAEKSFSLKMLVKPGTEIHSYDPSPADIIAVQNCSVFIYAGGDSDEWVRSVLSGVVKDTAHEPVCIKLMDFVQTVEEAEIGDEEEAGEETEQDEHVWTSPENEIKIINAVCLALCSAADNAGLSELKEVFIKNAGNYCAQIGNVAEKIKAAVDSAEEKYIVMADRFPLRYFADYYGLGYSAAFSGCSTAVEASTATIARLIDEVKTRQLPAVFYIELGNHKIADTVSEAAGVPAYMLYSVQNIAKNDFDDGATWVSLMKKNAETLKKGLR